MSFLQQQIKLIIPAATIVAVNSASLESFTSSGVTKSQAIIKTIRYMSIKLTSLLKVLQTNAKNKNLRQTYPTCINSFGAVLKKLIGI
jgi:hypothetical protein